MQVCEIMHLDPVCCFPEDTAEVAARTMWEQNTGILPVVTKGSGGKLIGVVTDRDLCVWVVAKGLDPKKVKVSECMTDAPVCCGPRDDIRYAMLLMREHQVRRIPVVDKENRIGGMLTFANLANHQGNSDELVDTLRLIYFPAGRALLASK
jgi:signal-transduction protein with cAMP-binding, CBS, and nucleotidyltransferase domain